MICDELKKAIIDWLFENKNVLNRINLASDEFRQYIYKEDGSHCINGENVYNFLLEADKLIGR